MLRRGDIFEYQGYFGLIITADQDYTRANWYVPHPNFMFRHAHDDADWYVPMEHWKKFKVVAHVDMDGLSTNKFVDENS